MDSSSGCWPFVFGSGLKMVFERWFNLNYLFFPRLTSDWPGSRAPPVHQCFGGGGGWPKSEARPGRVDGGQGMGMNKLDLDINSAFHILE